MHSPPVSHTTDEVVYEWDPLVPLDFEHEPNLPMHALTKSETGDCTTEYSTGKFTCVSVTLHLERMPGNFLLTVVVPGAMVIVISSCALWASGRTVQVLVVSVAFLLWEAIVVLFNATSVPISYTRACDVYTGMVVTFAFCNLMLSMISGDGGVQEQVKLQNMPSMFDNTLPMFSFALKNCSFCHSKDHDDDDSDDVGTDKKGSSSSRKVSSFSRLRIWRESSSNWSKVKCAGRVAVPAIYLLFLIVYFCAYM